MDGTKLIIIETEDSILVRSKGDTSYSKLLGLLEHAKMQLMCQWNEEYYKKDGSADDDLFK